MARRLACEEAGWPVRLQGAKSRRKDKENIILNRNGSDPTGNRSFYILIVANKLYGKVPFLQAALQLSEMAGRALWHLNASRTSLSPAPPAFLGCCCTSVCPL